MPSDILPSAIVVPFEGQKKRICKIIPLSDGGFSITPPSHKSKSGVLLKSPYMNKLGVTYVPATDFVPFTASDRVKLSYHPDGFVQFSTSGSSPIISGRDASGIPRGVGLIAAPLNTPINTGPSVSIAAWGLAEYQDWVTRKKEASIHFEERDFYKDGLRDSARSRGVSGFELSFMVFRTDMVKSFVPDFDTNHRVEIRPPRWLIAPCRELPARLIKVSDLVTLAVMVMRDRFEFGSASGYRMAGPSDFKNHIHAIYPPHAPGGESIDFRN